VSNELSEEFMEDDEDGQIEDSLAIKNSESSRGLDESVSKKTNEPQN
jgi:hypothetical protein